MACRNNARAIHLVTSKKQLTPTHRFRQILPDIRSSIMLVRSKPPRKNPSLMELTKGSRGPTILATNLLKSYFENGLINEALDLFDEMPDKDIVAWTAMIAGLTSCGHHTRAWALFCGMVNGGGMDPNAYTLSNVLKACRCLRSLIYGGLVHGLALKHSFLGAVYVDNSLLDMYATCSVGMEHASMIFRDMRARSDVSWTILISGYTHRGDGYGGLQVFREMLLGGAGVNPYSFSIAVRACATIGSLTSGRQIHAAVVKNGLQYNLPVMNSILDMYCRCGCLYEANQYFHEMTQKNLITWNTLISGYERLGSSESLGVFSRMMSEEFTPNCFTFTSIAAACANLTVLNCGQQVHGVILRVGFEGNMELNNALIDMYAKCGSIPDSRKVFDQMLGKNVVSWTSMMIGYGAHGYGKEAVELFDEMVESGIKPDRIVFMGVLSACSHAGLLDEGLRYFESISAYDITPDQEIYACVVDLLGRAGRVEEAYQLIQSMPFEPDESVWGALLGACKAHKLPKLGKLAALKVLDLRPNMVQTYVMLSNIYASEGKWGEFAKMRTIIREMRNKKEAGKSWIEVRNQVYSFVVSEKFGPHLSSVYKTLELLILHLQEAGYVPDFDCVVTDAEEGMKLNRENG